MVDKVKCSLMIIPDKLFTLRINVVTDPSSNIAWLFNKFISFSNCSGVIATCELMLDVFDWPLHYCSLAQFGWLALIFCGFGLLLNWCLRDIHVYYSFYRCYDLAYHNGCILVSISSYTLLPLEASLIGIYSTTKAVGATQWETLEVILLWFYSWTITKKIPSL